MITAITCTGDRPEAFNLCKQWMERQTIKPDQWIIVDDGIRQIRECPQWATYVRRNPMKRDPAHTLIKNIAAAIQHIKGDQVIFFEDDDYYPDNYVDSIGRLLNGVEIAGYCENIYYNVATRSWMQHTNTEHASLCATGISAKLIPDVAEFCNTSVNNPYLDLSLWRTPKYTRRLASPSIVIGMKAMPGRTSVCNGHKADNRFTSDMQMTKLRSLIGKDYIRYQRFYKQIP